MPLDFLASNASDSLGPIVKIAVLILLLLYAIFSFVLFTQVRSMNKIINLGPVSSAVGVIALVHILLVASLFAISLAIL